MAGVHARSRTGPPLWVVLVACVALAVVAAGVGVVIAMGHPNNQASATPTNLPPALTVSSLSPTGSNVSPGSTIAVRFSTALAPHSPRPMLSPALAGSWAALSPSLLQFQAVGPLVPGTTETITVPGGASGVLGAAGQHLAQSVTSQFTVAPGSVLRLQQLLAQLDYLPLSFTPTSPLTSPSQEANDQAGSFAWRWPNLPMSLLTLWAPGTNNVITQGAVMNFEAQNGLQTDGVAGPEVWSHLLTDIQNSQGSTQSWDYVLVSQSLPESATVYKDGVPVYSTPVNTGVAAAPTENGTWPVYARYTVTTMSGTNPDGSHYVDPGIPWVSYFHGGDALHGFVRASYGLPQSVGCVEMPIANAQVVYPLTPLGTLVTVQA